MRLFTKGALSVALVLSALAVSIPAQAAGLTSDQITAVLSLLQSFNVPTSTLDTVQAVLTHVPAPSDGRVGTSTPMMPGEMGMGKMPCISLDRNLSVGSQGDDVKNLQDMLRSDGDGFTASSTGYFGPLTAQAVERFQMKNGIASTTTGFVGPLTRAFFQHMCSGGLMNGFPGGGERATSTLQAGHPMIGALIGDIASSSDASITVQPKVGTSHVAYLTSSTTIQVFAGTSTAPTTGSSADLVVGQTVMVEGARNQDGSLNATTVRVGIQLPQQLMMGDH